MASKKIRPLDSIGAEKHTWTVDVLGVLRSLHKRHFLLADVYDQEDKLKARHPNNDHVREKIRQQLQVLRDMGLVEFLGKGEYRFRC